MVKINTVIQRTGIYLLVGLLLTTLLSTMLSSVARADGQNGSAINSELNSKVLDHQLYFFLVSCAAQVDMDKTTNDEVDAWEWFYRGDYTKDAVRGDMYDNGEVDCARGGFIREAFGRFGFSDPRTTICSLDFVYHTETGGLGKTVNGGNNAAACESGFDQDGGHIEGAGSEDTARENQRTAMINLLGSTAAGKAAALPLTPEAEYIRKYRTLMNGCQINLIRKITQDSSAATGNAQLFKIPVVNSDGSVEWWLGEAPWSNADSRKQLLVATTSTKSTEDHKEISCGKLSTDLQGGLYKSYATFVEAHPDDPYSDVGTKDDDDTTTSCKVDGVGWIVCPVMNFIAELNEQAFGQLQKFLVIEPELLTQSASKVAWQTFRDFANAAFVVAFLIIIYSQLTGAGITNYGVKKMLPKLVVAAILVNVSYYVCQLAVDISNIAGASIYDMFKNIPIGPDGKSPGEIGSQWQSIAFAILATGATAALLALVIFAPMTMLAVGLALMILIARKAFLILLVVISPLAFVAYLLPNTEQWFKRWWKAFSTLLVLYVVIAAIFGGSYLASNILMQTAECSGADCAGDDQQLLAITAMAVMAIPLFAVPTITKGALSAAGSVGAKLSGLQNSLDKRGLGQAKQRYDNTAFARGRAARKQGKQNYRDKKFAEALAGQGDGRIDKALGRARRTAARGLPGIMPGTREALEKIDTNALTAYDKAFEEDVRAASLRQSGLSNAQVSTISRYGLVDKDGPNQRKATTHELAAATDRIMATGSFDERKYALEWLAENKGDERNTEALRARAAGGAAKRGDGNIYGKGFANKITEEGPGTVNSAQDLAAEAMINAKGGNISAEHLVQSDSATEYVVAAATGTDYKGKVFTTGDADAKKYVKEAADRATAADSQVLDKVSERSKTAFGKL